jgi:hypothetical protein
MAERNPSDTQAAFGVFPQLKRNRSKQDREAAKNVPIDLARGAVAGVLGAPGDIESLVRMLPYLDEKTILPTSEDIEKKLPFRSDTPVSRAATGLGTLGGGFYYGPGSPLKVVGALPRAIKHGAEEFAKASVAGAPHVVKPKGGNWLSGKDVLTIPETNLNRLKTQTIAGETPAQRIPKHEELLKDPTLNQDQIDRVLYQLEQTKGEAAIDSWIDSNLTNYVKKQMATPEDPVRKLAEEGIIHTPLRDEPERLAHIQAIRKAEGFPAEGMGKSDLAKQWENLTDDSIRITRAGRIQDAANVSERLDSAKADMDAYKKKLDQDFLARMSNATGQEIFSPKEAELLLNMPYSQKAEILGDTNFQSVQNNLYELMARVNGFEKRAGDLNPFVAKLDPETRLYSGTTHDLGFDHIVDVLRQDVEAGRIRPEQLNKVSMEQAVRRTHEFDQEMAKRMQEAAIKQTQGFPTYKEYPEGYRWIELAKPESAKALPEGWSEPVAKGNALQTRSPNGDIVLGFDLPDLVKNIYKRHPETPGNPYTALEEALKYEGDTMGHCVGGYCPDVLAGRTRIFSLRDAKGEPHVTVETMPHTPSGRDVPPEIMRQWDNKASFPELQKYKFLNEFLEAEHPEILAQMNQPKPDRIIQIKGKQNAKPKEQYLPFVQDFVKGGNWTDIGDFHNTGLIREGGQLMTPAEHSDWLLKQLDVPPPAPEGMKRGGKVSISNNPDTMMLELGNRKMAKGGKAVKFVEDVAPAAIEKLAMMFGNKLPLNMNSAEIENLAKRFPEPVVDRVNMAHKDVLKRTPELQEAAARIEAGDMSADEYARLVQRYKPVTPYESVPAPASREEILAALSKTSREAEGLPRKETYFGKPSLTLKEGDPVGLRLDIPSYNQANTWVVTAHGPRKSPVSGGAGTRIGYEPVAMATDVDFSVSPKAALGIAKGAEKNTIATMEGKWKPTSSDEAFTLAKQYLKNPEWRQVGMDPERHSFFYDRETMAPVINAEEVIQIGPLVLAKNPKYGNPKDFKYASGGDVHMAGGGLTKLLKGVASEAERALPLRLPRATPKTAEQINAQAERVARQMIGEHVTSGKPKDTKNLAGRSMKESQRVQGLEYELVPTKEVPVSQVVEPQIGDIHVALPGDYTVSDVELRSLMGQPIGSVQEGGSRYGLGHMDKPVPNFWASGVGPAQQVQNKITDLYELFDPERVMAHHLAMGPVATNFAQHFADANLRAIDYSKLRPKDMYDFDRVIAGGYEKKNKKTGEVKIVDFPEWPGIADPEAAYEAMKRNPELRKWFNNRMKTPDLTQPLGLPNGLDIQWAISHPELRNMEVNLTGHSVGEMVPGAALTDTAEHNTYLKGIPGTYRGHQEVLSPFIMSFPDAAEHIMSTQRPQDFTGTIQKVFPHQRIDQQFIDEMGAYRKRIKELTGKKAGGAVEKPAGVKQPAAYINGDEFVDAAKKYGIKDSMDNLNLIVNLVNKGLSVDDAARQVADSGMHKAAGGAISGDDLIIEERPL